MEEATPMQDKLAEALIRMNTTQNEFLMILLNIQSEEGAEQMLAWMREHPKAKIGDMLHYAYENTELEDEEE